MNYDWKPIRISLIALVCIVLAFLLASQAVRGQKIFPEDKLKASYVYNFIRFIQWPELTPSISSSTFNICILSGDNRFAHAFQTIIGKKVRGRTIELFQFVHAQTLPNCHLLYLNQHKPNQYSELLSISRRLPILTVSDYGDFCRQGGMICLLKKGGEIRVEINLAIARSAGFRISSNLLEVVTIVDNP